MTRVPLEFYGYNTSSDVASATLRERDWQGILTEQKCPFIQRKCIKQRKSDAQQTIGACIVGYQDRPLIICPKRFLDRQQIFVDATALLNTRDAQFFIVPEIEMPGGKVDYFLVAVRDDEITDYLGLEIQSLDTTASGGIWQAREDLFGDRFQSKYKYGINWKMSAKTILIQLHHKAEAFEALGKKLVLVIQEQFLDYISRTFQTAHFRDARDEDSVHFYIYDVVELNRKLCLRLTESQSTDALGIERMLRLGNDRIISEAEIINKIKAKLPNALELNV